MEEERNTLIGILVARMRHVERALEFGDLRIRLGHLRSQGVERSILRFLDVSEFGGLVGEGLSGGSPLLMQALDRRFQGGGLVRMTGKQVRQAKVEQGVRGGHTRVAQR